MTTKSLSDPLGSFITYGPSVYVREPPTTSAGANARPSNTIVLCTWMSASTRNIATYVSAYSRLDPTARIIIIRTTVPDMVYRKLVVQKRILKPAVEAILAKPEGRMLIHLFSNGGAQQTAVLAKAYREMTGGRLVPVDSMIFDSTPGKLSFESARNALMEEMPKQWYLHLPSVVLVYLLIIVVWVVDHVTATPNIVSRMRLELNDSNLIRKDAERCYVYSKEDKLVGWRDVEEHCDDAEARGYEVNREIFERSAHVRHVKHDPDRYWSIPQRLLNLTSSQSAES